MEVDKRQNKITVLEKLSYHLMHGLDRESILHTSLQYVHMARPSHSQPVLYDVAKNPSEVSCLAMVRKLAALKVDFCIPNKWGLLMALAREGKNIVVIELIENHGMLANTIDDKGNSLLHIAALTNSVSLIDFLLRKGVQANLRNKAGTMAVDVAIRYANTAAAKVLFAASTDNSYREQAEQNIIENFPVQLQSALQDIHQRINPEATYPYEIRQPVSGKGGKGTFSKSGGKYTEANLQAFLENGKLEGKLQRRQQLLTMVDDLQYCKYGHLIYTLEDENGDSLRRLRLMLQNVSDEDVTTRQCCEVLDQTFETIRKRILHLPNFQQISSEISSVVDPHLRSVMCPIRSDN